MSQSKDSSPQGSSPSSVTPLFQQKVAWRDRFNALSEDNKNALYFMAIHTSPIRKDRIQELCGCFHLRSQPAMKNLPNTSTVVRNAVWNPNVLKECVEKLSAGHWIVSPDENSLCCADTYREPLIQHLVQSGQYPKYADQLFMTLGGRFFLPAFGAVRDRRSYERPKTANDMIREFRHILINNETASLQQLFHYIRLYDPSANFAFYNAIRDFCFSDESRVWFANTNRDLRSLLCQFLLVRAISELTTGIGSIWEIALDTVTNQKYDQALPILLLDYALCAGKLDDPRLNDLSETFAPMLLTAHRSFLLGNYAEAVKYYQMASKLMPQLKLLKNSPIPYLSGVYHCLAEIRVGNRSAASEIVNAALSPRSSNTATVPFPMQLIGCWKIIESIILRMNGQHPKRLTWKDLNKLTTFPFWFPQLLYGYESIWFQLTTEPELSTHLLSDCAEKKQNIFPWVAAESIEVAQSLGAAKQAGFGWVDTFRKKSKSLPLRNLFVPRSEWELILESLESLVASEPKKNNTAIVAKEKSKSRLTWRVQYHAHNSKMEFIPYEQVWEQKSQNWTAGKQILLARLFKSQNSLHFLTEQDREICSLLQIVTGYRRKVTYEFNDDIALKFVGHPLLFSAKDPSQRVEITLGHGELSMQEKDGNWHITFSPPLQEHTPSPYVHNPTTDDGNRDFFVLEDTPLRFKVVLLSKQERQIRKVLGSKGQTFPKKAESSLVDLLKKLAGALTVKTDAKIEFTDIPEIPADSKLYLYLTPNGDGLQAEFFVKPLGVNSPAHRPGVGSERVIAEIDDQKVQTVRHLETELKQREQFISKIPAFQSAVSLSKDQYLFETPLDALTFLSELKDSETESVQNEQEKNEQAKKEKKKKTKEKSFILTNDVEIYWPYGEKFAVSSTAAFGNMNLSFSTLDEWLSAEGSISVDGYSVELLQLLELLDDNMENRFVKLDNKKFLTLTNELRKRLGELKRLSHIKGKSVQIHPLAAAGLEDFFDAVPVLQKDVVWNDIKKRIAGARDYQAPFPKGFVGDLRDYQLEGYRWLARCAKWGVGCCLADDMGLGKTIQALMLLLLRADQGPALVAAPTSVCFNWEREAERFAPILKIKRIQPMASGMGLSKEERDKLISSAKKQDVLVTSYSLLQQEIDLFAKKKYATVILDESQAIKNPESLRAKAVSMLQTDFRVGMTGTPIENNLTELWSLFRFLNPGLLGSLKSFEDRFAVPIQREQSLGARTTLRRLVHPFILRRTKSQVLEELPARTEIVREIELSNEEKAFYEAARTKAIKELQEIRDQNSGRGRLQILAALTRLRQICCHSKLILPESGIESSKLEAFREIMQELKDNRHKVLVFSQFVRHLDLLRAELDAMGISYQYLDGSTPERERQKRVDAFQSGEFDAFLISIKAGGSGLNLTAADYVIHTDPWWNPAVEDQATDRAHRIGQTRPVTVYRLITLGTIEEKIVRLHHEKRDLADKLLEGTDQTNQLSSEDLIEILRS
ncbi:MAG: DEAD/DEAH box helicase [Planctomycetaceae bacterium]|nr:DEAD/DEAH box helicase [Planctomycetaceae bacterium]